MDTEVTECIEGGVTKGRLMRSIAVTGMQSAGLQDLSGTEGCSPFSTPISNNDGGCDNDNRKLLRVEL